jgi:putative Mg2+ transporter-C (MgtC) family protein
MTLAIAQFAQPFNFNWLDQMTVVNGAVGRLFVACLLGSAVGLEREISKKAAGLRTNILICLGSAFFTLLSPVLAGETGANRGQVASNIVQGIGFLGAGLIIHNRSRISGLTSAASVWVVASIGMACGAGLYAPAFVATVTIVVALEVVGFIERRGNLKIYPMVYEARGHDQTLMLQSILSAMDKGGERLTGVESDAIGDLQRVSFSVTATNKRHRSIHGALLALPGIQALFTFRDPEED